MPGSDPFYDDEAVRSAYEQHRGRSDNPNDSIERPIFLELAADLTGLDIVDLGCGDAGFGREALAAGAASYLGIDSSLHMVEAAHETLAGSNGITAHMPLEDWLPEPGCADLVTARLSLNYVEHLEPVFRRVVEAPRPGGRFICSIEHPVGTSSFASLSSGRRTAWLVDDYFRSGARPHQWLGRDVVKYHRTIEEWIDLVHGAGLSLVRLRESRPRREHFLDEVEYERRLRIPLFLFFVARRPAA